LRIYDIVLFVFLFNLSLSIVNELGITQAGVTSHAINGMDENQWVINEAENTKNIGTEPTSTGVNLQAVFSWMNAIYQYAILAVPKAISVLLNSTIGVYPLLITIGVPNIIAIPLSTAVYFIYIIGAYQMFSKTSFKDYQ